MLVNNLNFINMERNIDEKFDFLGCRMEVKESESCDECFFFQHALDCAHGEIRAITGECMKFARQDNKEVIFKEVT